MQILKRKSVLMQFMFSWKFFQTKLKLVSQKHLRQAIHHSPMMSDDNSCLLQISSWWGNCA